MHLNLRAKTFHAGNVWSFTFAPAEPVVWLAGQFIKVGLPHSSPDSEGQTRFFTITAAPHEKLIIITTRITHSSFKQALSALPIGGTLSLLDAPAGDFTWRSAARPHLFVAQGIGITPFYAIIKDRLHQGLPASAQLIYGNQPSSTHVFAAELAAWAAADPSFTIQHFPGTLTPPAVAELAPDYPERFLYVSGPKSFISLCTPPHKLPLSQLKQDNFPGYAAVNY